MIEMPFNLFEPKTYYAKDLADFLTNKRRIVPTSRFRWGKSARSLIGGAFVGVESRTIYTPLEDYGWGELSDIGCEDLIV